MTAPADPDKPLPQHAAARVSYAKAAAEISDYAAAVVPTSSDNLAEPGEFITQARRARTMAMALLVIAVLLERALGRSWKQIAHAYGQSEQWVRATYAPVEAEWIDSLNGRAAAEYETVEMASLIAGLREIPVTDIEVRKAAAELDAWCERRRDQNMPSPTTRLVSDGLAS